MYYFCISIARPGTPTNLQRVGVGVNSITISWTEPIETGGIALTGYDVIVRPYPSDDQCTNGMCFTKDETLLIAELKPQTSYSFSVVAVNCADKSIESGLINIYTRKIYVQNKLCMFNRRSQSLPFEQFHMSHMYFQWY